ncbi:MAG: 50S ribosomal protein L15 [Myxococcales bacterium]|nr:50S ribosomal protein L15 [Myxococcales bacterium]
MDLSNLEKPEGATQKRTRKGRGPGSGLGKTCGRGHKGQKSRSGGKVPASFEGGQMPLIRRIPKFGFVNNFAKEWSIVNLADLERVFEAGDEITPEVLAERGLIWSRYQRPGEGKDKVLKTRDVKVLAKGSLTKALTVKAHKFSKSAEQAIVAAGGSIEVI